jgi:hypothetical protein
MPIATSHGAPSQASKDGKDLAGSERACETGYTLASRQSAFAISME